MLCQVVIIQYAFAYPTPFVRGYINNVRVLYLKDLTRLNDYLYTYDDVAIEIIMLLMVERQLHTHRST